MSIYFLVHLFAFLQDVKKRLLKYSKRYYYNYFLNCPGATVSQPTKLTGGILLSKTLG